MSGAALRVRSAGTDLALRPSTRRLLGRMLGPLCGLDQMVGFMMRGRGEARLVTSGAELTGVHLLRHVAPPKQGSYHIGGAGVVLEEAVIKSLAESLERYSQLVGEVAGRHQVTLAPYEEIAALGEPMLPEGALHPFTTGQLDRPGFPFSAYEPGMPLGWVRAESALTGAPVWVPAQLVLVGYVMKGAAGERWIAPAVTTGSAVHVDPARAWRNALLELIQIDAAMGLWYSGAGVSRIEPDRRTAALRRLVDRHFPGPPPEFYWLPSPDLGAMIVACIVRGSAAAPPALAVGLGADLDLERAMYKAMLEGVGVLQLAKITLWNEVVVAPTEPATGADPASFYDLDRNVGWYSLPGNAGPIEARFGATGTVAAADLPADAGLQPAAAVRHLLDGFRRTGKQIVHLDLTTPDVRELGFWSVRVWSPDTLSLCLPSAPPARHPRFAAFGGMRRDDPHPYP